MKTRHLFTSLLIMVAITPFLTSCDDEDDYEVNNDFAKGQVEINDIYCNAGTYDGYAGWDTQRQVYILPLTYKFTLGDKVVDSYFTFTFTGQVPKVGENLAVGRDLTLSTDGKNVLPYHSGKLIVRAIDMYENRITVEYDGLEMGADYSGTTPAFDQAPGYEIDGWQTVSFDFSTGPGAL